MDRLDILTLYRDLISALVLREDLPREVESLVLGHATVAFQIEPAVIEVRQEIVINVAALREEEIAALVPPILARQ